jgi:acyl-CoA thioesterase
MAEPAGAGSLRVPANADPAADLTAVEAMLAGDAASAGLGMQLTELGLGSATVTMTVRPDMVNGHEIGHGGYVFLVADTAFACACNSRGPVTVAAGADVTFIRSVRAGDLLTARAIERAHYGRSGLYDVTVSTADGVVAEFRGRSRSIGRPQHDR